MNRVVAREEYCIGCRLCEIHCLVQHSRSKRIIKAFRTERGDVVPGVRVEQAGHVSFALQCRHCDDAPCIEACMTGAMHRDASTGAVLCDQNRCVGCWMCIMVCPVGAVKRGAARRAASKCDLCVGAEVPACVFNCPNEALTLREVEAEVAAADRGGLEVRATSTPAVAATMAAAGPGATTTAAGRHARRGGRLIGPATRYVIVGNSAAAIGAVVGIREMDPDGSITLISREPYHTYSRPLITHLLADELDEARMDYRPRDFYEVYRVNAVLGVEAVSLEIGDGGRPGGGGDGGGDGDGGGGLVSATGRVTLSDGRTIPFDRLLLATGGKPVVPSGIEGLEPLTGAPGPEQDECGVFTVGTLEDALRLKAYIRCRAVRSVVVLGGGLIGIKCAEALTALGVTTTVVELADRVLPAVLDRTASALVKAALEKAGVRVRCATSLTAAERPVSEVVLGDGSRVACSAVVVAVGVTPDTSLAAGTGLRVDRGILVNQRLETSLRGVYAAGDVASAPELLTGASKCVPILPNAYRQGLIAGANMAGADRIYEGSLAMNSVNVFGLPVVSVGAAQVEPGTQGYEVLATEPEAGADTGEAVYKKVVLKEDRIVGALFVGDIDRAGIFTGLLRNRVDVSRFKHLLLTEDFGVISLPSDYRKYVVSGMGIEA